MDSSSARHVLNGEEPGISGQACTGFFLQHSYADGQIIDQVNVAYLKFKDQWYRLYFEAGTIFWRVSVAPAMAENSDLLSGLLLNDLSGMSTVVGQTLDSLSYLANDAGDVGACLEFRNGKVLRFSYLVELDATRLAA